MRIVLVTNGRPELTLQTINTLESNAVNRDQHELLVVFDGPMDACANFRRELLCLPPVGEPAFGEPSFPRVLCTGVPLGVGGAKNFGVEWFRGLEFREDDDHILMFSDNDMYYLPGWDAKLKNALESFGNPSLRVTQLGGWRHPFHGRHGRIFFDPNHPADGEAYGAAYEVDAATGNCFVMNWQDWFKYGPFESNAIGPGQSEDYALSQKIKAGGGIVATLDPPVAIHCGIANCLGESATGWKEMSELAETQMKEFNINKIWLSVPEEGTILLEKNSGEANFIRYLGANIGSGQRRFTSTSEVKWLNIDSQLVDGRVPDIVCDVGRQRLPLEDDSLKYIVLNHVAEHEGCGEATPLIQECWRVLQPGGSLIITVPNMRALAGRWLGGEISTQIYMTNVYGAYMGDPHDRHKWGFDEESLGYYLGEALDGLEGRTTCESDTSCNCGGIHAIKFDWRTIPGADIPKDWWIIGFEVVK